MGSVALSRVVLGIRVERKHQIEQKLVTRYDTKTGEPYQTTVSIAHLILQLDGQEEWHQGDDTKAYEDAEPRVGLRSLRNWAVNRSQLLARAHFDDLGFLNNLDVLATGDYGHGCAKAHKQLVAYSHQTSFFLGRVLVFGSNGRDIGQLPFTLTDHDIQEVANQLRTMTTYTTFLVQPWLLTDIG